MNNQDVQVSLKSLLQVMVCELVDDTSAVEVRAEEIGERVVISIEVAPEDIGKLIGKSGKMARSLRTVAGAAARKYGTYVDLNIVSLKVAA